MICQQVHDFRGCFVAQSTPIPTPFDRLETALARVEVAVTAHLQNGQRAEARFKLLEVASVSAIAALDALIDTRDADAA